MNTAFRPRSAFDAFCTETFRIVLDCLARPGTIGQLTQPTFLGTPLPITTAGGAVPANMYALGACMSLIDQETNFVLGCDNAWLLQGHEVTTWVHVRTNARRVAPQDAQFAYLWDVASLALIPQLPRGTLTFPERSTTVFCAVPELSESGSWRLRGPGLDGSASFGTDEETMRQVGFIQQTRTQFPLGVDVFLIDQTGKCVGLPRTTRIELSTAHSVRGG